jgi:hypothetical protein
MGDLPSWLTVIVAFLAAILGSATTIWVGRRTRFGALDQSIHDKRLEIYPHLVKAGARLAVYFPSDNPPVESIGPQECREMGQAMSQ